jgi:hypothetical protein
MAAVVVVEAGFGLCLLIGFLGAIEAGIEALKRRAAHRRIREDMMRRYHQARSDGSTTG